jgi:hypothetical protein
MHRDPRLLVLLVLPDEDANVPRRENVGMAVVWSVDISAGR